MKQDQIKSTLKNIFNGSITEEEHKAFYEWLVSLNKTELARIMDLCEALVQKENMEPSTFDDLSKKIKDRLDNLDAQHQEKEIRIRAWKKYAVAASILLFISLGGVAYFFNKKENPANGISENRSEKKQSLAGLPGGDKAVLTLGDGSTILLDDAQNGQLTEQGNTRVIKINGKLDYKAGGVPGAIVYNTLSTPRGGQFHVVLPDGTAVWLNAASSLRFPTSFSNRERRVEVSGEAYFEVAKNKKLPFIVSVRGSEIKVLGTHFNVMAYEEEDALRTSLLEGSVEIVSGGKEQKLIPGQQSQLFETGKLTVINDFNVDDVMAWKNGYFHFEGVDIGTITRQLARWYDVEVMFKKKINNGPLHAEFPRNIKLANALRLLEHATDAQFRMEGKKIIVN